MSVGNCWIVIKDAPGEGNYDGIKMKLIGVDSGELWSERCQEGLDFV